MKTIGKKFSVVLLSAALLVSQDAFAARLGKSRNSGMQRNITTTTSNKNYNNTYTTANSTQPQPTGANGGRQGMGVGAVVAGAAAGAVGGYLVGKAMNDNQAGKVAASQVTAPAAMNNESHIPWGLIAVLGLLLAIGLMLFRRKATAQTPNPTDFNAYQNGNPNSFSIPPIQRDSAAANNPSTIANTNNPNSNQAGPVESVRMADGVESQYFLRQAKGMFLHIQSMNSAENVSEVAKYLTPDLYAELKETVSSNSFVADFSQLDCQLLDSTIENGNHIASVKFSGKVSEEPNAPLTDFSEIWHFVKPATDGSKWVVAGIQQTN